MKFIRNTLNKIINWARTTDDCVAAPITLKQHHGIDDLGKQMTLNIYPADGGKVIRTYRYDNRTDKETLNLYVIHNEDDLAQEISMILTKEALYQ